jgi:hypothetical protein
VAFKTQIFKADFQKFFRGQAPGPPAGGVPLPHPPLLRQAIPHQKILAEIRRYKIKISYYMKSLVV